MHYFERPDDGEYQTIMKQTELPMVSNSECQDALRTTRLGMNFTLHRSFVCAGGVPGEDTCRGDGGGPIMCPLAADPETYVQVT